MCKTNISLTAMRAFRGDGNQIEFGRGTRPQKILVYRPRNRSILDQFLNRLNVKLWKPMMPPQSIERTDQRDLFAPTATLPQGFVYRQDFISRAEEQEMIQHFELLPFKPFEFHGFLGKRRVVSFGWRYDFAGRTLRSSETIPSFLLTLRQRAAEFADVDPDGLQQILINEYASGAGIGWHRDKPMFEEVIGLSFGAPCVMRLRRALDHGWERASCPLQPRSVYLLRGPSRQEWQHSIPHVDQLRYSVTFRNFIKMGTSS